MAVGIIAGISAGIADGEAVGCNKTGSGVTDGITADDKSIKFEVSIFNSSCG